MNNVVIGRYIPGNSFLYRMDPRTKLITLVLLMATTFILANITAMLVALGFIILLLAVGRISIKRVYLGLRPLMFLLIFTFSFQIFFNTQGNIIFEQTMQYTLWNIALVIVIVILWMFTKKFIRFKLFYFLFTAFLIFYIFINLPLGTVFSTGTLAIHQGGVVMAFFIMLRLVIIVVLSTILTLTTKPTDLNLGLESVLKPLKLIRVNTEEMAMIISISLRYIPTLLDEANKIMLAQASRGVDFTEGKIKDKVMQIVSLLVPMFIISFKRSDELANAMEARSFVPGQMRTRLHVLTWGLIDTVAISLASSFLITSIALRIFL